MPFSWFHDTATVIRPDTKTSRGTTIPDWSKANETDVDGCELVQLRTSENRDGRTETQLTTRLIMPVFADVQAGDRVAVNGVTYVVQGEPMLRRSPTGRIDHISVDLAVWRG